MIRSITKNLSLLTTCTSSRIEKLFLLHSSRNDCKIKLIKLVGIANYSSAASAGVRIENVKITQCEHNNKCPNLSNISPNFTASKLAFIKSSRWWWKWNSSSRSSKSPVLLAFLPAAAFYSFFKTEEDDLSVEDKILMDIKRAILAIKRDQLVKAEKYLAKALKESQREKLDHAITQILDIQANLAFQKGEFEKSAHLFMSTMRRLIDIQGYSPSDNSIIEMSLKLAQIYEKHNQFDDAMIGYQYCIDTQKEKLKSKEPIEDEELKLNTLLLLAWASHNLAQIHMKFATSSGGVGGNTDNNTNDNHIKTASRLSTEAYNYAIEAEGSDSQHALTIQSDLATIEALSGNIESALKNLHQVRNIAKEKFEELFPSVSVNIGSLYLEKGSYDEAEKICKEAKLFAGKINDIETFSRAQECILKCSKLQKEENEQKASSKKINVGVAWA